MSRGIRCFLLFLALAATAALPAAAQQFPSQQRGLSADTDNLPQASAQS